MKSFLIVLVFIAVLLSGCGLKKPNPVQMSDAYYGEIPQSTEEAVRAFMEEKLFDPYSAVIKCGVPQKSWVNHMGKFYYGWNIICSINAKNRYGAYVGVEKYHYLFQGEKILRNLWATQGPVPMSDAEREKINEMSK